MITFFFSSLCYPVTFAVSLEMKPPIPGLPFILGGLVALVSAAFSAYYFSLEKTLPRPDFDESDYGAIVDSESDKGITSP